jgi:hypothetical protein
MPFVVYLVAFVLMVFVFTPAVSQHSPVAQQGNGHGDGKQG